MSKNVSYPASKFADYPLKEKYRQPGRLERRTWDPQEGTRTFSIGLSSKRSKKGGNSGPQGKKAKKR